jgi:L-alanine-DL-glutamate epimerase-like enolase superfamily enzyme
MADLISRVNVYPLSIPRETPYLGPLEHGVVPNEKGYFIRPGNASIYSVCDHSVLVRVETKDGVVGWGECVSVVAPQVATAIITEIVAPLLVGRDPLNVVAIHEDLYNAMRVRGFFGGFYLDVLAAVDIALWDARGRMKDMSINQLLGARRTDRIPAYVSDLPRATLAERAQLAAEWVSKGFNAIKMAAAVAHEGVLQEMKAVREAVGPAVSLLMDLHWAYSPAEAVRIITALDEYDLYVAEAPVRPEDIEGLAYVEQLFLCARRTRTGCGTNSRSVQICNGR